MKASLSIVEDVQKKESMKALVTMFVSTLGVTPANSDAGLLLEGRIRASNSQTSPGIHQGLLGKLL
eukprot:1372643-Amorphochlora_amoeboformis.AAC.1